MTGGDLVLAVVVAWLLFTKEGRTALVWLMGLACLVLVAAVLSGCAPAVDLECNLDRIAGTYHTTDRELARDGGMVRMHRDGRVFMFPRNRVIVCHERQ